MTLPADDLAELHALFARAKELRRRIISGADGLVAGIKPPPGLCPYCNRMMPPVFDGPDGLRLPPVKARIYDAVRRWPDISAQRLRDIVWADAIDGGPLDALHSHIAQLNKLLTPYGIAVRADKKGMGATYRIREAAFHVKHQEAAE